MPPKELRAPGHLSNTGHLPPYERIPHIPHPWALCAPWKHQAQPVRGGEAGPHGPGLGRCWDRGPDQAGILDRYLENPRSLEEVNCGGEGGGESGFGSQTWGGHCGRKGTLEQALTLLVLLVLPGPVHFYLWLNWHQRGAH